MKAKNKISILIALFLVMGSCSKLDEVKNPLDGFKLIIDYDIFNTFISFRFLDSNSGELIGTTDQTSVEVIISGIHKDGVVNQLGEKEEVFNSFSGLLTLALNPKDPYVPSTENPIQFNVISSHDGYYGENTEVSITEDGNYTYNIYLEKKEQGGGIRKYYRTFDVGSEGSLNKPITINTQKEGELCSLPVGTKLLDSDGQNINNEQIHLLLTVYENFAIAPIPQSLIVQVNENELDEKAFDVASVVEVEMWSETKKVTSISGGNISLKMPIKTGFKNPITEKKMLPGEAIKNWVWNQGLTQWEYISESQLFGASDGLLYFNSSIQSLGVISCAVEQNLCNYSGNVTFNLDANFIKKPVKPIIYCTRKFDGKYIGQLAYSLNGDGETKGYDMKVPENGAIEVKILNNDNTNSFLADPVEFLVENACTGNQDFTVNLEPTAMDFSAAFQFHFQEGFPNESFMVNLNFFDDNSGKHLLSVQEEITNGEVTNISTSMQQADKLRVTYSAAHTDNSFQSVPNELIINNPQAINQFYEIEITPDNCLLSGNFNFNFLDAFPPGDIDFKVEVRDATSNQIIENVFLKCSENQNVVPLDLVLSKHQNIYLKLKRITGETKFHVSPYEFSIGTLCQKGLNWNVDISPVEQLQVDINVRAVCPDTEIIPTLTGYYRLVWDEQWNEVELVYGNATLNLELNGIYEMGIIVDGELVSEVYTITGSELNLEFELDDNQCDKFGY